MKKGNVILFMQRIALELKASKHLGTAHIYRSTMNAVISFQGSEKLLFRDITPEWLKSFESSLRSKGCSWNTVSTYLRTLRAVYNRAVDCHRAPYVPNLFRSVYTGTRADRQRALDTDDMKKLLVGFPQAAFVPSGVNRARELFIL